MNRCLNLYESVTNNELYNTEFKYNWMTLIVMSIPPPLPLCYRKQEYMDIEGLALEHFGQASKKATFRRDNV